MDLLKKPIVSSCCYAELINDHLFDISNICSKCNKVSTPVYAEIECKECGGPIKTIDNKCMDCKAKF